MGAPDLVEGIDVVFMSLDLRVEGSIPTRPSLTLGLTDPPVSFGW